MKVIILFLLLLATAFPQGNAFRETFTDEGKIVSFVVPISLTKSATNYSDAFSLDGYLPTDTLNYLPINWQSNDTVQVTIALQVKNSFVPSGYTGGTWVDAAVVTTLQANAGNDTLHTKSLIIRGSVPAAITDLVSMAGRKGDTYRFRVTFANQATVGNSGTLRIWMPLKRR
jgi:hypothetical protein